MHGAFLGYLDPGAGSILVQFLVGILVGVGLFYRRSLLYIARLFRRSHKLSATEPPTTNA